MPSKTACSNLSEVFPAGRFQLVSGAIRNQFSAVQTATVHHKLPMKTFRYFLNVVSAATEIKFGRKFPKLN